MSSHSRRVPPEHVDLNVDCFIPPAIAWKQDIFFFYSTARHMPKIVDLYYRSTENRKKCIGVTPVHFNSFQLKEDNLHLNYQSMNHVNLQLYSRGQLK